MSTKPIGVVGLGIMGSAMSASIMASGRDVVGFDIDAARLGEHAGRGGLTAASATELAARCDVVVTSLTSSRALEAVLTGPDGLCVGDAPGLIIIETSTLSPDEKSQARHRADERGAVLLDCPMSGTGQQARSGDIVAYLSGDSSAAKAAATEILLMMCRAVYDVGTFGNGTRMKLIANLLVAVHNAAAAEALVLAKRSGMDLDGVLAAVGDGAGASRMLAVRGPLMISEDFSTATMRVSTFQKDIDLIAAFASDVGSPTPLFSATADLYRMAVEQGRDDEDTACVFGVLESLNPRP